MKKCIHFPLCGGCSTLNVPYQEQLDGKQKLIGELFSDSTCTILPIIPSQHVYFYRHKVQLPFGYSGCGKRGFPLLGCYAADSHKIVDQKMCFVQHHDLSAIAWTIREWAKRTGLSVYNERLQKGFLRHVLLRRALGTGEILIGLVTNGERIEGSRSLSRMLLSMVENCKLDGSTVVGVVQNINMRDTNVVLGNEERVWWGRPYIKELFGELRYKITLSTFFQVNPYQMPHLYNEIKCNIPSGAGVIDSYCGVGSIALWIARQCSNVVGIEENRHSVRAAREAAKLNGINNVSFIAKDAEDSLEENGSALGCSCAVLDPPRKGISEKLAVSLTRSSLERIVYVSCNPESLRRDAAILGKSYVLASVRGVDMFPHTDHIECIAVFNRR